MRLLERPIKSLLHTFGLEILRANTSQCPKLPPPPAELVRYVADSFSDSFRIADQVELSSAEIEQRLQRYEWFYHFNFGGIEVGPNPGAPKEVRGHYQRYLHIFPSVLSLTNGTLAGNSILDVACNAGFWSLQAKRLGATSVLGIDSSEADISQARFVAQLIGMPDLEYQTVNAYDITKDELGDFDITFFLGLLYHLDSPVFALRKLYEVTKKFAVIDTQLTNSDIAILKIDDDTAARYHAQSYTNTLALIPSESAVLFMLKSVGFRDVFLIPNHPDTHHELYLAQRWGTFIAYK
jgi:2-polyprenyl-3-methyl-5-hydroxy-6-metoxy-1,4-benzoquinol methylase